MHERQLTQYVWRGCHDRSSQQKALHFDHVADDASEDAKYLMVQLAKRIDTMLDRRQMMAGEMAPFMT
jgi:hypothetical protein